MSPRLPYPFDYYWKKYKEGKCPFCNSDIEQNIEKKDVIHCSIYGGYLAAEQDNVFSGPEGDGYCKDCSPAESPHREEVEGEGFLCENCGHGVYFSKKPIAFQELFKRHESDECRHCTWHNKRSPSNPIVKPDN